MRLGVVATAVCMSVVGLSVSDQVCAAIKKSTAIPAQDLGSALQTLARERGLQFVYITEEVNGRRTQGVVGVFTPEEALKRLLTGTGMTFRYVDDKTVTIEPVIRSPEANFSGKSSSSATTAKEGGTDRDKQSSGDSLRLAQSGQGDSAESAALANNVTGNEEEAQKPLLEQVVVTGSRGLQRSRTDSPTPVDVITSAELEHTGKPDVLSALNALIPSFNEPVRAGGATASVIMTGGLRGLNPDQTLILVDGKRRHKTSLIYSVSSLYNGAVPTDLDLIPVSAIDHIEVLRDGAAAKYGSDAIAGVINIILKQNVSGVAGSIGAGQNMDRSDGQQYPANLIVGQRFGEQGYFNVTAQGVKQDVSNRANAIDRSVPLYNRVNGQPDPREATVNRLVTLNYGAFAQETVNTGYNGGYKFGDVELYSFGTYSKRRSELAATFRAPNNPVSLPEIYPNGFRPDEVIHEDDFDFTLGARGILGGWNWDLSSTYGSNRARLDNDDTINASLGPTSPTSFYIGTLKSTEWDNSLDVTRGYEVGSGKLQLSSGLQHRQETYRISAGDYNSYAAGSYVIPAGQGNAGAHPAPAAQGAAGIQAADAGFIRRNNLAAYIDVEEDPTDKLILDAAGRFEHYDDASGNTLTGEGSGRYAMTPWLAFRGAASTGFRAPALAQEIYSSTTGQFRTLSNGTTTLLQIKTLPLDSPTAIALGAQPLKPETSTNYSLGTVITPSPNLNFTLDGYQITVRDRITITSTLTGTPISQILAAHGLPPIYSAQYYTNAIDTRTRGFDAVAEYQLEMGRFGKMRLNAGFNYNETSILRIAKNPPQLSALGPNYTLFDRVTQGNMTELLPKNKLSLADSWTLSRFTLRTKLVRYGGYTIPQLLPSQDRYFGAKWITDMELDFQATRELNLAVGATNIFNLYPDANGLYNASLGSQQYGASPPSPFGFTGGFYYCRVSFSF